ncbi:hypothetical protein AMECASPLE_038864 [Ameca splendens]|uniref:Uncharacterized protein n=1 Tax=Ameca splendens TaxID=208324 RepID=A0ABV0XLC5_9TELE
MYGEEVELSPSPLLLEEMEECFGEADWADVGFEPGRNRCSPAQSSSKRRRSRHKRSTSAAASAELPPSPPAAAEFSAGFSSCPGRRHRRWAVATEKVRVGASNYSMEGPSAMTSSRLSSPELVGGYLAPSAVPQPPVQPPAPSWIEAGLEGLKRKLMKNRCCKFVLHLMDHPEDLDWVHSLLQDEFLAVGWLDAPAPLSAGGPFDPLLWTHSI